MGKSRALLRHGHRAAGIFMLVLLLALCLYQILGIAWFSAAVAAQQTPTVPAEQAAEEGWLLPDLQTLPPRALRITTEADGIRRIRFSTTTANLGQGPLEMWGEYDASINRTRATQHIHTNSGVVVERHVGDFVYHEGHTHWHFEEFVEFELWSHQPDGALDQRLSTTGKMSFCILDNTRVDLDLDGAPQAAQFGGCGQVQQGISVGWGDTYAATVSGQELDITGIPDGHYAIRSTADPVNRLLESDETNNSAIVYIELIGNRIERQQSPAPQTGVAATLTQTITATSAITKTKVDGMQTQAEGDIPASPKPLTVATLATDLVAPWALAFAPDGRIFVTERPGRLRVLTADGELAPEPVTVIADVAATGEGGLLGLALDPAFATNRRLYLYYTYRADGGLRNRVVRYTETQGRLANRTVLLENIPGANIHNGGRIAFGPDDKLYITTGDAAQAALAQDRDSLAGKILRINPDGSIPKDNPFAGSPVYSYGHRNAQGLTWHPESGQLYATEHGPSGNDEVNLIAPGANYGWPEAQGEAHPQPYVGPLVVYTPSVAPSGAVWYSSVLIPQWQDSLFFTTLRGRHLHRLTIDPADPQGVVDQERLYDGEYGRLRAVAQGPDGALYLLTSNRDGRGSPAPNDDRLLRIVPGE